MTVEIRAWLHPLIVSFKGVLRTSCPVDVQEDIEGTVAYRAEVYGGDGDSVTDKFGVVHPEIPLVTHADYKALEEENSHLKHLCDSRKVMLRETEKDLAKVNAELAECRKDAERYRALKADLDPDKIPGGFTVYLSMDKDTDQLIYCDDHLDEAIDNAIARSQTE